MTKRPPHRKIKAWGRGYWRRVGARLIDRRRYTVVLTVPALAECPPMDDFDSERYTR